ncbi:transposase, partial [Aeromonas caviae]
LHAETALGTGRMTSTFECSKKWGDYRAKTITLILDNYIIHKSKQTERWLKKNPKFCLVFQPVYSPWVNHIERLWHKLHETITRNHQCRGMASLLARVKHFMDTVSPFPGNGYGTAMV